MVYNIDTIKEGNETKVLKPPAEEIERNPQTLVETQEPGTFRKGKQGSDPKQWIRKCTQKSLRETPNEDRDSGTYSFQKGESNVFPFNIHRASVQDGFHPNGQGMGACDGARLPRLLQVDGAVIQPLANKKGAPQCFKEQKGARIYGQ